MAKFELNVNISMKSFLLIFHRSGIGLFHIKKAKMTIEEVMDCITRTYTDGFRNAKVIAIKILSKVAKLSIKKIVLNLE